MAKGDGENVQGNDKGTSRSRWATRRLTVKSSGTKRTTILDRIHRSTGSTEKNRQPDANANDTRPPEEHSQNDDDDDAATANDQTADEKGTISGSEDEGRILYFNQPLPPELKDEEGNPKNTYARNKIRTAKYTPLSFVPKNLWFQFHNIANIFFLFLVILVVSYIPCHSTYSTYPTSLPIPTYPYQSLPIPTYSTKSMTNPKPIHPHLVLPCVWRRHQSRPQCGTVDMYYCHHCDQRCHRRLPPDHPRPRAQQCTRASPCWLEQRERGRGQYFSVEKIQKGQHSLFYHALALDKECMEAETKEGGWHTWFRRPSSFHGNEGHEPPVYVYAVATKRESISHVDARKYTDDTCVVPSPSPAAGPTRDTRPTRVPAFD